MKRSEQKKNCDTTDTTVHITAQAHLSYEKNCSWTRCASLITLLFVLCFICIEMACIGMQCMRLEHNLNEVVLSVLRTQEIAIQKEIKCNKIQNCWEIYLVFRNKCLHIIAITTGLNSIG